MNPIATIPLIAPKPVAEFTADEYHTYVQGFYQLPATKRGAKPPSPAPGLAVSRTKKGALSVRRTKARAFAYVTFGEVQALALAAKCTQAELWNCLKARKFIIAKTRMEAEHVYAQLNGIPF